MSGRTPKHGRRAKKTTEALKSPALAKPVIPKHRNPGPGNYYVPGSMGAQVESTRASTPSAGFGTSPSRASLLRNADNPGPGAYRAPDFGEAPVSTKKRNPQYSMRGRELFGSVDEGARRVNNPGPGAYGRTKVQGKAAPAYSLGMRIVDARESKSGTPGPGRYKGPSSFGRQVESHIKSHAGCAFERSTRPPLLQNQTVIGPGEYSKSTAVGRQVSSKRRTKPAFSFGTASRFAKNPSTRMLRAGPGSYRLPDSVGSQPLSTLRSAPAPSIASRHNFGSPYPDI